MTTKSNINVDLAVSYTGKKNIKNAERDILGLGEAAKKLGAAFAIERLITKSLAAFKAETVAVTSLTNALSNLGVSFASIQPVIEEQVTKFANLGFTSAQTMDAMSHLTTALGNPAKALDVLGVTADLARYKQAGLTETADTVAKAIAGSSRAFALLGLKIDKTLSPQNAFNKLIEQATQKAGGLAQAYAGTAAGAMDVFAAKSENASAILGAKMAPALAQIATFASAYLVPVFTFLADHIDTIAAVATGIGAVTLAMKGLGVATAIATGEMMLNPVFAAAAGIAVLGSMLLKKSPDRTGQHRIVGAHGQSQWVDDKTGKVAVEAKTKATATLSSAEKVLAAWEKQWNATSLKQATTLTQAAKDKLAAEKASLSLKIAGNTTDMQNIEIQAALQRGQDELTTNVLLNQRAQITGNAVQAGILTQEILKAQGLAMDVGGNIAKIGVIKDPFTDWAPASTAALAQLKAIQDAIAAIPKNVTITFNSVSTGSNGVAALIPALSDSSALSAIGSGSSVLGDYLAGVANNGMYAQPGSGISTIGDYLSNTSNNGLYSNPGNGASTIGDYNSGVNVTVVLNGQAVGNAITSAQVDQSASGIPNSFQRNYAGGW
jgi:hypothetical protein